MTSGFNEHSMMLVTLPEREREMFNLQICMEKSDCS